MQQYPSLTVNKYKDILNYFINTKHIDHISDIYFGLKGDTIDKLVDNLNLFFSGNKVFDDIKFSYRKEMYDNAVHKTNYTPFEYYSIFMPNDVDTVKIDYAVETQKHFQNQEISLKYDKISIQIFYNQYSLDPFSTNFVEKSFYDCNISILNANHKINGYPLLLYKSLCMGDVIHILNFTKED